MCFINTSNILYHTKTIMNIKTEMKWSTRKLRIQTIVLLESSFLRWWNIPYLFQNMLLIIFFFTFQKHNAHLQSVHCAQSFNACTNLLKFPFSNTQAQVVTVHLNTASLTFTHTLCQVTEMGSITNQVQKRKYINSHVKTRLFSHPLQLKSYIRKLYNCTP